MRKISYSSKDFVDFRTSLIQYTREYYPNNMSDFNDASIAMLFIELNAAMGDNLSFHLDKIFTETQVDNAKERNSLIEMCRTFNLKVPGKKPSTTIVDFSVTVPVKGDTFDIRYAPIIRRGTQISGSSKVFETTNDIDFSQPFNNEGLSNRTIIPRRNANGNIINYTLTKREFVVNGSTKYYRKIIGENDVVPFLNYTLPDTDVLSIESVIIKEGTNHTEIPSFNEFYGSDRWYETESLSDGWVFKEDNSVVSDNFIIKPAKWELTNQRFITEKTNNGFTKIIFGGGVSDVGSLKNFGVNGVLVDRIGDIINNSSLGIIPRSNHTLFVKYRVGGGVNSNIGPNILNTINYVDMFVYGPEETINSNVRRSLTVNNILPAIGGKDHPTIDELRYLLKTNYASQNRAVTLKDYKSRIELMPGEFGVPFRVNVMEESNKVNVYIIALDQNNKLTNQSTSVLKSNISEYLSNYRMMNDYVVVKDGKVFNLGFEFDLMVDKTLPNSEIISSVINEVNNFMDINKRDMGDNVYLSKLMEIINNVSGVINVIDIRIFNKVGGKYSLNEVNQSYINEDKKQIDIQEHFTLFGDPNGMFEIKYPESDIKVRVR